MTPTERISHSEQLAGDSSEGASSVLEPLADSSPVDVERELVADVGDAVDRSSVAAEVAAMRIEDE